MLRRLAATAGAVAAVAFATTSHAMEDVPFVTSADNVTMAMLEMARVGKEDTLIDLGSGDGRIVIVAASRFGAKGLGVEIDPVLVQKSRENARGAGVEERARFAEQDLFKTDLSGASVITLYLLPDVNLALRPRILALAPGTRVVSHDWDMGDWKPDRTVTLPVPDKKVGLQKTSNVHLWVVPAQVDGLWCAKASGHPALRVSQRFQQFSGELATAGATQAFEGRIEGAALRLDGARTNTPPADLQLAFEDKRLRVVSATGGFSALSKAVFERAPGARCG